MVNLKKFPHLASAPRFQLPEHKDSDTSNAGEKTLSGQFAEVNSSMSSFGDVSKPSDTSSSFVPARGLNSFGASLRHLKSWNRNQTTTKTGKTEHPEEFVPTAQFTPLVPLPALLEKVIFQHRAKIFRFEPELKEWKVRGLGDIKILQSNKDLSKIRIFMVADDFNLKEVHCNHWLSKDMKIKHCGQSTKMVTWTALETALDSPRTQIFTCKFENENAVSFFSICRLILSFIHASMQKNMEKS